jgi:choline-glycine betaine transporter
MENLIWVIYFIDVITQPMLGLGFLLVVLFILGMVVHIIYSMCNKDDNATTGDKDFIKLYNGLPVKTVTGLSFTLLLLSNFIPTQNTAYKMLAAYGVSEVSKSDNVQELMGDGLDVLKLTLKDYKNKLEKEVVSDKD